MTDNQMVVWGRHPVEQALQRGTALRLYVADGLRLHPGVQAILNRARAEGITVERVTDRRLLEMTEHAVTQGLAATVSPPRPITLERSLSQADGAVSVLYVVLDQIQDPHNLGAVLRTANAAGVSGVILPDRRTAPLSGTVAKVSAGAVHSVQLVQVQNLRSALDTLRKENVWIVGLDERGPTSIYDVDLSVPTALVLGSEGSGLRPLTRDSCDVLAHIPMAGDVPSLNVSVAAGVAVFEAVRQRGAGRILG